MDGPKEKMKAKCVAAGGKLKGVFDGIRHAAYGMPKPHFEV